MANTIRRGFQAANMPRRRTILKAAALGALAAGLSRPARAAPAMSFPADFAWGVSTSSYQVEGAVAQDGRAPSIWDVFCRVPGKVLNGDTGDVACDHYHRYGEDVELIAQGGFGAYRFSIAWPRVVPQGTGAVNAAGLDFYERLVDALLHRGVTPWACLYHWDLPQALQAHGGWTSRDSAAWFADYAAACARRLGDRVRHWATFNEPNIHAIFGHGVGQHAPGLTGEANYLAAIHHQNLAHGRAVRVLREAAGPQARVGIVLSLQPSHPSSARPEDAQAAAMFEALWNGSCLDPVLKGAYPALLADRFAPLVRPDDLREIAAPIDWLGVNYYSPTYAQAAGGFLFGANFGAVPAGIEQTGFGWPVAPEGLREMLARLRSDYGNPPVYITENGAAFPDAPDAAGRVEDGRRIAYFQAHLAQAAHALAEGCALKGYFAWSLLDNFEWAAGYTQRFGIVHVDFATQERRPKASYDFLRKIIAG